MEITQIGATEPAAGPAGAQQEAREDPYPDGAIFRVWSLFVRAIIYGAGAGVLVVIVMFGIWLTQAGGSQWLAALPAFLFFAGLVGAVVGAVAATGALIAVLVFVPFAPRAERGPAHPRSREGCENALPGAQAGVVKHSGAPRLHSKVRRGQAQRRALVAGVGAAVAVCVGWMVFVVFVLSDYSPVLVLVPAVIGAAVAGGLAWFTVGRADRASLR